MLWLKVFRVCTVAVGAGVNGTSRTPRTPTDYEKDHP